MFTEPPRLVERIARKIDDTPKVDPFSLIRPALATSAHLADLMSHPSIVAELKSVGLPESTFDSGNTNESKVHACLPFIGKIRNTATSWRLFRILNDLYDFTDGCIDSSNADKLSQTIADRSAEPNWAAEVLSERTNVVCLATSSVNQCENADARLGVKTQYFLDVSTLLSRHFGRINGQHHITKPAYLTALVDLIGEAPVSLTQLNAHVGSWLASKIQGATRFTSTRLPMRFSFKAPDEGSVNHLLERASGGILLTDDETDIIVHAVAWAILGWHHENRRPVQIIATGHSPFQPTTCPAAIGKFFSNFCGSQFIVLTGTGSLAETFTDLAARIPNLAIAGFGSSGFVNERIASELKLRLQTAPIAKQSAFLSHAPTVEWTYGNYQIVRRGMANALASMIEDDLIHENDVQGILKNILHDSPRSLYGLE